jgi:hypothetical protein
MAQLDAFSSQIVRFVRTLSDEAILALVRNQLDSLSGGAPGRRAGTVARGRGGRRKIVVAAAPAAAAPKPAPKAGRSRRRQSPAQRKQLLAAVERVVRGSKGLSASEIATRVGQPQERVTAAVRELKTAKRIFQGGDRRFARYAGDGRTAHAASLAARKNASGSKRTGKK